VTFRITKITEGKTITIRLEGRIDADAAAELEELCRYADHLLRLDLSGVLSADNEGVQMLRRMSEKGTELFGESPYVRQLLDTDP